MLSPLFSLYLCRKCGIEKSHAEFAKRSDRPIGKTSWCLKCRAAYMHLWRSRKTPEKLRAEYRRDNLKKWYGITPQQYDEMLAAQGGVCAICKGPPSSRRYHVDHDHVTGRIRGLLCHGCNTGLGGFKESPEILRKAMKYMSEPKIVEAVGKGTVNLSRALDGLKGEGVKVGIAKVRVQKIRDGKVYEDVTLEAKHGFHG